MIHIAAPDIGDEEVNAVNAVLKSGMLAQGPKVAELEAAFAKFCGTKYALAVNSGTAAIHAALYAAGVGPGDEVITTPFSFIATINPIIMLGATPVLADIDPVTFNIDPAKIEDKVTPKTKVIMPVHLYGQPCDHDEIQAIADKHALLIIEDACQAVGALYDNKKAGALGDMACFSLYATKNIMCGEGGVVTTNDENFANAVRRFRQHGMVGPYQYEGLGYNYRMTDLQAAIAVEQLKKCDKFIGLRRANASAYDKNLDGIKGVVLPEIAANRSHVYHQYTIRLTKEFGMDRQVFIDKMKEKEVGVGVYYPKSLHTVPHISKYGFSEGDFPQAEKAASEVVSLPVHTKVSKEDIKTVVDAIRSLASE